MSILQDKRRPSDPQVPLLELENLSVHFQEHQRLSRAVDGISLQMHPGETLALLGESGSGKSLTALAIMGLLPQSSELSESGDIRLHGHSLRDRGYLQGLRGKRLTMIFQDPASALNPVFRIGEQLAECLRLRGDLGRREVARQVIVELGRVGLHSPEARAKQYPHQMSGGMLQRVMIAMAMCNQPDLLIADEPTTALDVTVQSGILNLMEELQESNGMGILLITHDLGVVAERAQRVALMYAGKIMEYSSVDQLFERPQHPYSQLLLRSLPESASPGARLPSIEGQVPRAFDLPSGCRFRTRCPLAVERCSREEPGAGPVACHFPGELLQP